jgi:hypothetical protein
MEPTSKEIIAFINNYQIRETWEAIEKKGWQNPDLGRLKREFKSGTYRFDPDYSDRLLLVVNDFAKDTDTRLVIPQAKVNQYIQYLEDLLKDDTVKHRGVDTIVLPDDAGFEKIIGERNNLKSINWLLKGLKASKSVCRIVRSDDEKGTGFVIAGGYLITNAHVIPTRAWAAKTKIEFNFEEDIEGNKQSVITYFLDESDFQVSSQFEYDYVRVKIKDSPEHPLSQWGTLEIDTFSDPKKGDSVVIIQHPDGGVKQIALDDNDVINVWKQYLFW